MYNKQRHKEVADLLRTGHVTPELEAEYEELEAQKPRSTSVHRHLWDLPVFERCWKGDVREVER